MEEVFELLDLCYTRLQGLQIKATRDNLEALLQSLYDIRRINEILKEGGSQDVRAENNT